MKWKDYPISIKSVTISIIIIIVVPIILSLILSLNGTNYQDCIKYYSPCDAHDMDYISSFNFIGFILYGIFAFPVIFLINLLIFYLIKRFRRRNIRSNKRK